MKVYFVSILSFFNLEIMSGTQIDDIECYYPRKKQRLGCNDMLHELNGLINEMGDLVSNELAGQGKRFILLTSASHVALVRLGWLRIIPAE